MNGIDFAEMDERIQNATETFRRLGESVDDLAHQFWHSTFGYPCRMVLSDGWKCVGWRADD